MTKRIDCSESPQPAGRTTALGMVGGLGALYGLWWLAALAIQTVGAPLQALGPSVAPAAAVLATVWIAAQSTAVFTLHLAPRLRNRPRQRIALIVGSIGVALIFWHRQRFGGGVPPLLAPLGSANLVVFACLVGTWLPDGLRRPAELVPVGALMALVDAASALAGPTRQIAESIETYYKDGMAGPLPVGDALLVKSAFWGSDRLLPVFGVSDWVMVVFLTAAALKFDLNDNLAPTPLAAMVRRGRTAFFFPVAAAGLILAVWLAHFSGRAVPALPLVAGAHLGWCLLRYPHTRRLSAGDRRLLLGMLGIAVFGWAAWRF
ncbi:MAG: hypothetical protein MUF67_06725 [Desulfobacterales bacterium]|nr:hypothetical protein [Desulfobacterales bacterium]